MNPDDLDPQTRRQFDALIASSGLEDLRRIAADLLALGGRVPPAERPRLRRPPKAVPVRYRVRVDLDGATPPIWRRLDLRSDLTLDVVHQVLQAAFGWCGYHLHRFSIGGGPFDSNSELFLCEFDVEEGEDEGTPDGQVRLDETLQEPGDVLHYAYDYGDSWELTIRLEEVLPAQAAASTATCVDGRRAAPPEDCGGLLDAAELAEVLDDPAAFDVDEVNAALRQPYFALVEFGVNPALVDLVNRLRFTDVGDDVAARALALASAGAMPTTEQLAAVLRPHQWLLDRAAGDGIVLTAAGYLKPADVVVLAPLVPTVAHWWGKNNRESHAYPLLEFRESMQRMGLLRKLKGRLVLTKAGKAARQDVTRLWRHLADRLRTLAASDDPFTSQASLLTLLYAATSADANLPLDRIAQALREFRWATSSGPVQAHHLYRLEVLDLLRNVSDRSVDFDDRLRISPAAAALARSAQCSWPTG